uniref:Peptidase S1 domain-containing protein n=1 Tax=Anopheles quadriannulatus TaxID=34691 RepID=A0A182WXI4_ANOQN
MGSAVKIRINMASAMVGVVAVALLIVACCQIVVAQFNQCKGGESCIDINECAHFGPHHTDPSKWSVSLKRDFRDKLCRRESNNGKVLFKVCCQQEANSNNHRKRNLTLLDLEKCGPYIEEKIANGIDAILFQYPWMALLQDTELDFVCGGTISVRLGEFDLKSDIDCDKRGERCALPPQDIAVERTIKHKDYSARHKVNDIALIRLASEASYNENVMPICLPVSPEMRTVKEVYYVSGWGFTENGTTSDVLQVGLLRELPNDVCQQLLRRKDDYVTVNSDQMCAIGANRTDNCAGDSGGPLKTIAVNARFVQYGVVSYGLRTCGKETAPGVYTRVENYIDWILDELEE